MYLLKFNLDIRIQIPDINTIKQYSKLAVDALENIHRCGFIHLDVKHENFAFEKKGSKSGKVFVIDYGISESIYDRNGKRKIDDKKDVEGSIPYMSIRQHEKQAIDYMHDLQAIAYMILDLLNILPWKHKETIRDIYIDKVSILNDYIQGKLSGNMKTIGKLIHYTTRKSITDFNSNYYKDVKNIIDELQ